MCFGSSDVTQTSQVKLPAWMDKAAQENVTRATGLADAPFQGYDGNLVAGFSGDQQRAFDLLSGYNGGAIDIGNYGDKISGITDSLGIMQHQTPSLIDGNIQDDMDPYIQSVMQDVMGNITESGEIARNNLDAGATMAGAFGDARHGIESAQLTEDVMKQKGQFANQLMSQAFNNAMGLKQQDIGNALNTFGANVGAQSSGLNDLIAGYTGASGADNAELANLMQYVQGLSSTGGMQQQNEQAGLDSDYSQYMREYEHPYKMMDLLNQTVSMQPHGQTSTGTTPGPSGASQALGIGLNLLSMI